MYWFIRVCAAIQVFVVAGCTSVAPTMVARSQSPAEGFAATQAEEPREDKKDRGDKDDEPKKPPKTLFEWTIGSESEEEGDEEEVEPIVTDRPDFTEASSTVGNGRVQLEAGYTYYRDRSRGVTTTAQTYPEALLRIGLLADWFEFRVGQTYARSRAAAAGTATERLSGMSDLYLGTKLGLTEQKRELPEIALVLQALVPTGAKAVTANEVLPGFNLLYGWDVIPDFLTAGGSLLVNRTVDDLGHSYVTMGQSFTIGYTLTEQLGAYTEWFALYPTGAVAPGVGPQHYFDGGFTYKVTPEFQLDIRAGVGLNRHAEDFFAGVGFAYRY